MQRLTQLVHVLVVRCTFLLSIFIFCTFFVYLVYDFYNTLYLVATGGRSEKGGAKEKGAAACVQTRFPCLLIVVLYTAKDGSTDQRGLLYQDSLQATGAYSQVPRLNTHHCLRIRDLPF